MKKLLSVFLIIIMILVMFPTTPSNKVLAADANIVIDGNNIKPDNLNGLTFKGFGVLSANGTSGLLMDYKSQHPQKYAQMLQILFGGENPVMTHVKIEMGNDRNNSTGPDPATMRLANETANVQRHPGFQLAADAKKVNPNLKVSILRWNAPGWVNNNDKVYTWYKNTILAAYRQYGYMVDYVNPGVNESAADLTWTKQYAERVRTDSAGFNSTQEQTLYNSIKIVISDEVAVGSFGGSMVKDASLRGAVSVAGYHYNTDDDSEGNFKRLAVEFDKEIWNSEAQATFSNSSFRPNNNMKDPTVAGTGIGGAGSSLEMGNTIIKGFFKSHRTHFIYQPAIGAFYEGGQYSFKELISARDPWSGWIHYDAGLVILRHFSWFSKCGWENGNNTSGIWRVIPQATYTGATGTNPINGRNGTPSYMTLAAPNKSNFSTVIINDSEYSRSYTLKTTNMGYTGTPALELWETRGADKGAAFNSNYMKYLGKVSANNGVYNINVKPYSIVTVTTLEKSGEAEYKIPLPVEGERTVLDTDITGSVQNTSDNILYADDFDYWGKTVPVIGEGGKIVGTESYIDSRGGSKSLIPRYTSDRNGAFEVYLPDGSSNYVLRQQVNQTTMGLGGTWNNGKPITGIGDYRWLNYKASVDVSFEHNSTEGGDNYVAIGARQQGGGNSHYMAGTPYFLKFWYDGGWSMHVNGTSVASGNVVSGTGGVKINGFDTSYDAWHNIAIKVVENKATVYLDGVTLHEYTDSSSKLSGRIDLASGYFNTRFDNLKVEKVDGYAPYYLQFLDNLEMNDLSSIPSTRLFYSGSWAHENGKSMYNYQRSLSTSKESGATIGYKFKGTGLHILGPNTGSAKLEVTVDGKVVNGSASTMAAGELYQTFTLRGLNYGEHTVQLKVLSGTLVVDSVGIVSGDEKTETGVSFDPDSSYKIVNRNSGKVLTISGDDKNANSARIQQFTDGGHDYQRWKIVSKGMGLFNIVSVASGKYLDVVSSSIEDGAHVIQWTANGGKNQDWSILANEDGLYSIVNSNSGKYMDISEASTADGAQNIQWTKNSGNNQQWEIIKDDVVVPSPTPTVTPTSVTTHTPDVPSGIKGDIDGDGIVSSTDFAILKRHVLSIREISEDKLYNADVYEDGSITSTDCALMKKYLLGIISSFSEFGKQS